MKEALKLALEALETLHDENMDYLVRNKLGGENNQCMVFARDVIKSIKRILAQQEPWCMKMNGCKTKCEDCPVEVAQQEPVAKYSDIVSDGGLDPRNKFDAPPQLEERNFCLRCGKRTADLTVIHTCTPPQENT